MTDDDRLIAGSSIHVHSVGEPCNSRCVIPRCADDAGPYAACHWTCQGMCTTPRTREEMIEHKIARALERDRHRRREELTKTRHGRWLRWLR